MRRLSKPTLLVMGKTGSIGGTGKTNKSQIKKDMKTIEEEEDNILDNEDDQLEDGAMYPAGLIMDDDDVNDRNIKDDDDNDSPLDRDNGIFISKDDDEGLYPEGVR